MQSCSIDSIMMAMLLAVVVMHSAHGHYIKRFDQALYKTRELAKANDPSPMCETFSDEIPADYDKLCAEPFRVVGAQVQVCNRKTKRICKVPITPSVPR